MTGTLQSTLASAPLQNLCGAIGLRSSCRTGHGSNGSQENRIALPQEGSLMVARTTPPARRRSLDPQHTSRAVRIRAWTAALGVGQD